jgi:hypothetical protein
VFALFINIFVDSPKAVEILVQLGIRILSQTDKAFIIEQPVVCRQFMHVSADTLPSSSKLHHTPRVELCDTIIAKLGTLKNNSHSTNRGASHTGAKGSGRGCRTNSGSILGSIRTKKLNSKTFEIFKV